MKLNKIDRGRKSSTPHYIQLAKNIRNYISDNSLEAGEALPSERDISEMTGMSRVTVRKALNKLSQDKVIQRKHGAGTFILPRIDQLGTSLSGFTRNMHKIGMQPEAIWIMKAYGTPTTEEADILKITGNDRVVRLGRVRLSDGQPLGIEHAIVPARLLPDITQINESLYEALHSKGNRPVKGTQTVSASIANPTEAGLLSIPENSEVLRIERRSALADDTPVELTRSAYRGDRYDIMMNLEYNEKS